MDASKRTDQPLVIQQDQGAASSAHPLSSVDAVLPANAAALANALRPLPAKTPQPRNLPEVSDLVLACRHHPLRTLCIGTLLSSLLVGAAWSLTHPLYKAESLVRVREHQDVVFSGRSPQSAGTTFLRAQEKLVLSAPVLAASWSDEDIQTLPDKADRDAISWFKQFLQIDIQPGSEVLSIAAVHKCPQTAQAISSAVARAYLNEVTTRNTYDRDQREQKLEQAAREADKRLDELWTELNNVAQAVGADSSQSLTIRDELQLQAYRDYAKQLRSAQQRSIELQRQLGEQRARDIEPPSRADLALESLLQSQPDLVAARQRLLSTESQLKQTRQLVATDDSPRLVSLIEQRDLCAAEVDRLIGELRCTIREQTQQRSRTEQETSLAKLQRQIDLNGAEIQYLQTSLNEIETNISRSEDKNGVQLDVYRHAVDRQTRLADGLWQSLQELKIEGQSQPRVALLSLATLPNQPNRSRQLKFAATAGVIGWVIAILGVGYLEWRDCRVRFAEDLISVSAFPVFGSNFASTGPGFKGSRANSGASEAAARIMLLSNDHHQIPTLMISSATAAEPRHWVTLELAQAFHKFKCRTIIIDCDTSLRGLSKSLVADKQPGILQYAPQSDIKRKIIPTDHDGIDLLPLGLVDDETPWVSPQHLRAVIRAARPDYQVIIINGSAVTSSAESLLLASQVDLVLFSVFLGISRWSHLAVSEQSVARAGIAIGGSILHSGKCSTQPTLMLEHPRRLQSDPSKRDIAMDVADQLSELQNDLRQAHGRSETTGTENRLHQESPA